MSVVVKSKKASSPPSTGLCSDLRPMWCFPRAPEGFNSMYLRRQEQLLLRQQTYTKSSSINLHHPFFLLRVPGASLDERGHVPHGARGICEALYICHISYVKVCLTAMFVKKLIRSTF